MKKFFLLSMFFLIQTLSPVWAQSFLVKNIEINGLKRTSVQTVESYLPIKRGQYLKSGQSSAVLRALYKTGFFEKISVSRAGDTLVVNVVERPTIGQLKITGNSVIPTDKLKEVMTSLDIAEGRVYNPAMLEKITQGLLNQYYQLGRFNAKVDVKTTPMTRHRVMVEINISEGLVAKIRQINILGNHAFSDRTLIKQLDFTTSGLLTFISQTDRYSEAKLEQNTEKLRNFYLDNGYLHADVKSGQAEITPDRKSVYINFVVDEGQLYTISGVDIDGDLIFSREAYFKRITVKPGEPFSRSRIVASEKDISKMLGERGYMYANISLRPKIDEKNHQVFVVFDVAPGKRTYVHHITFSDNTRTNDVVLRREMTQMEAAPVSTNKLEESKQKLSLLPFIKEVDMSIRPTPDANDQVDINYRIKEENSAQATAKLGYAQAYGLILGAGLNQKNFMGTGNTLGINLSKSKYEQVYGIEYTDPYFTEDGISQSINFAVSRTDPGAIKDLNSGYVADEYNLGLLYGIPVGQEQSAYNRIFAGASYQNILINLIRNKASNQVLNFINNHGRRYQELDLKFGYSRDSRDRAIFPTRGSFNTVFVDLFVPLASTSLGFYTFNYSGKWYLPLTEQFIILTRADLAYGNAWGGVNNYPFFKNFYAGGINSVRGYYAFSLGPRDSLGLAYGGNQLVDASIGLIFPNFISENVRTMAYFDAGNAFSSLNNKTFGGFSTNAGPLRYSVGIEVDWITSFGPIQLSLAKAINPRNTRQLGSNIESETEPFQFALGANF